VEGQREISELQALATMFVTEAAKHCQFAVAMGVDTEKPEMVVVRTLSGPPFQRIVQTMLEYIKEAEDRGEEIPIHLPAGVV
jgi:hypothetical protein